MDALHEFLLLLTLYMVFATIEGAFPAEQHQPWRERFRNIFLTFVFFLVGGLTTAFLYTYVHLPRVTPLSHAWWYTAVILVLSIFLTDFIFYWYHRAQHTYAWLWPIHALHHSDRHLNATSSLRTFWVESPIQSFLISLPVSYVTGVDIHAMVLLPSIMSTWLLFTHTNIRLSLGNLTPVVCGPQLHRLHHSILPKDHNLNFAQYFPIIDVVFGTYRGPLKEEFSATGIDHTDTQVPWTTAIFGPVASFFNTDWRSWR